MNFNSHYTQQGALILGSYFSSAEIMSVGGAIVYKNILEIPKEERIKFIEKALTNDNLYDDILGDYGLMAEKTNSFIEKYFKYDKSNPIITKFGEYVYFEPDERMIKREGYLLAQAKYAAHFISGKRNKNRVYNSQKVSNMDFLIMALENPSERKKQRINDNIIYLKELGVGEYCYSILKLEIGKDGNLIVITFLPCKDTKDIKQKEASGEWSDAPYFRTYTEKSSSDIGQPRTNDDVDDSESKDKDTNNPDINNKKDKNLSRGGKIEEVYGAFYSNEKHLIGVAKVINGIFLYESFIKEFVPAEFNTKEISKERYDDLLIENKKDSEIMSEGGKVKKVVRRNLPINTTYRIIDSYYTGGLFENPQVCDNCNKPIANVAEIEDANGKKFNVGMDCAKTLSGIGNTLEFMATENNFKEATALRNKFNKAIKEKQAIIVFENSPSGNIRVEGKTPNGNMIFWNTIPKEFFFKYLPDYKAKIINPEKNGFYVKYEDNYDFNFDFKDFFLQSSDSPLKKEKEILVDDYVIKTIDTRRESKRKDGSTWYSNDIYIRAYDKTGNLLGEKSTLMSNDVGFRIIWLLNEIEFNKFNETMADGGEIKIPDMRGSGYTANSLLIKNNKVYYAGYPVTKLQLSKSSLFGSKYIYDILSRDFKLGTIALDEKNYDTISGYLNKKMAEGGEVIEATKKLITEGKLTKSKAIANLKSDIISFKELKNANEGYLTSGKLSEYGVTETKKKIAKYQQAIDERNKFIDSIKKMAEGGDVDIEKTKLKYALQDIKLLEKSGYMGITDTKHGVLLGEYKNGIYNFAKNDGTNLFSGNRSEALNFVKNSYQVEYKEGGELDIAEGIRKQLGHKTLFMLGAKDLAGDKKGLSFKIRGSKIWKHIKIELNSKDLYDITFSTWHKMNLESLKKKTINDVPAENMHSIIEKETGLYTHLSDGGTIYDTNKITTIIISNKAPLSTALETITGKSWNKGDFDGSAGKGEIFTEKSTGRKFTTLNVAEAKAEGAKGIHVPSEGTIHDFYESIEKNGLHTTVGIYLKENYLMPDTIDGLIGGYATSRTDRNGLSASVKYESELTKRIARYSFKHATEI